MTDAPLTEAHCTVCGAAVTTHAARCPNCGISHPARVLARGGLWATTFVIVVAWVVALAVIANAR